ncbi:MAG: hypothetical protein LUQ25_05450, partial [Methanoregulaceae archaeon]|nr:hypothetical protein [Methanoregulaceae archaeon]
MNVLQEQAGSLLILFAGGLIAGILTNGTARDGAFSGAAAGVIITTGLTAGTAMFPHPDITGPESFLLSVALFAIFSVPLNAVSGMAGSMLASRLNLRSEAEPPTWDVVKTTLWSLRGIVAGALIIGFPVFLPGSLSWFLPIPPIAAGCVAGYFSRGGAGSGAVSGLLTAVFGVGILVVPLFWLSQQATGNNPFAAGSGIVVLIIVAILALPFAT